MTELDLSLYFKRVGFDAAAKVDFETLRQLHLGHILNIPFENFDVLFGKPPKLGPQSTFKKLVVNNRGGYCFEMNGLFKAVLDQLGFSTKAHVARVLMGSAPVETKPQTHKVLTVELDGQTYFADVGFGGGGLLEPILLEEGIEHRQSDESIRLEFEDGRYFLQTGIQGQWINTYCFTLAECFPIDFVVANHYTATHPDSKFTKQVVCNRRTRDGGYYLAGRELKRRRGQVSETQSIEGPEEYLTLLKEVFALDIEQVPSVVEFS
ncbi:MAG: arylamine N-acetyltransferase [Planctomycetota bacterium]|nr:arylamine N-acetyltransferase [Planctomycetota bacterium]